MALLLLFFGFMTESIWLHMLPSYSALSSLPLLIKNQAAVTSCDAIHACVWNERTRIFLTTHTLRILPPGITTPKGIPHYFNNSVVEATAGIADEGERGWRKNKVLVITQSGLKMAV